MRSTLGLALLVSVAACGGAGRGAPANMTQDAGAEDAQASSPDDAGVSGEGAEPELDAATQQPDAVGDGDAGSDAGDGDGHTDAPDAGDGGAGDSCQTQAVAHAPATPELLIVLDRSGSMDSLDTGGNSRWASSVKALTTVTAEQSDQLEFGLMLFPGDGPAPEPKDCSQYTGMDKLICEFQNANAQYCKAGSVLVEVGLNRGSAIDQTLSAMRPEGDGTPTALTLVEAGKYLTAMQTGPGATPQLQYVLLVTDGEPNCGGDVDDTVTQIQKLAQDGIKTFVIGYEVTPDQAASADRMAAAGDTGYTKHLAVQNEATLVAALQEITGQLASCSIALDQAVTQPEQLLVSVDGHAIILNQADGNGFSVRVGGKVVTLHGSACEVLRKPGTHQVSIQVLCQTTVHH